MLGIDNPKMLCRINMTHVSKKQHDTTQHRQQQKKKFSLCYRTRGVYIDI